MLNKYLIHEVNLQLIDFMYIKNKCETLINYYPEHLNLQIVQVLNNYLFSDFDQLHFSGFKHSDKCYQCFFSGYPDIISLTCILITAGQIDKTFIFPDLFKIHG